MTDPYGRTLDYLRLSLTDMCNLRCIYCMPEEGAAQLPREAVLGLEECAHLCRILAGLGIRRVKITGGEPLLRNGLCALVRALALIPGVEQITLTTNGILLGGFLSRLRDAGIGAVNVSLDTLNSAAFRRISRRDGLEQVLQAIGQAYAAGLPLKVNCVPIRGLNDGELVHIAGLAKERDIAVRFIELMPAGRAAAFQGLSEAEVRAALEAEYGALSPFRGRLGNGPAEYYAAEGFAGKIGFIGAMSRGFCERCNRLRLTSAGVLKACLSSGHSVDLGTLLRRGADDGEIAEAVRELVRRKPRAHSFSARYGAEYHRADEMFRVGG